MKLKLLPFLTLIFILLATGCQVNGDGNNGNNSGGGSTGDGPSSPINGTIDNLKASCYEFTDRIELKWKAVPGINQYKVRRFNSKSDPLPQKEFTTNTNSYVDLSGLGTVAGTPYFYKVEAVNGEDSFISEGYVLGIYDNFIDLDNNDSQAAVENSAATVNTLKAVIYSFPDNNGYLIKDEDWYVYSGLSDFNVNINNIVTTLSDTQFQGRIMVQFLYYKNGLPTYYPAEYNKGLELPKNGDSFYFGNTFEVDMVEGTKKVYIRVFINPAKEEVNNFSSIYNFKITEGL